MCVCASSVCLLVCERVYARVCVWVWMSVCFVCVCMCACRRACPRVGLWVFVCLRVCVSYPCACVCVKVSSFSSTSRLEKEKENSVEKKVTTAASTIRNRPGCDGVGGLSESQRNPFSTENPFFGDELLGISTGRRFETQRGQGGVRHARRQHGHACAVARSSC